ncbi:hypothetical protein B0I31_12141 [Saccharothrix carnea]|uniref:Transcriptional regulator n=1 Tax=Saccharothrix carnea TaxID=1280637 RepID=A0A2P8HYV1_SACCR|nr:transcriptional regulator [Saccharothrix carnea]PSL51412.1 hypothetical protein B0I31_12141 [Saccharothrix carnea]
MSYTVRVRSAAFTEAMRARFGTEYRLAAAMSVNRSTLNRVLTGSLRPGPAFIAGALTAFAPITFDALFDIVATPDTTPDRSAR